MTICDADMGLFLGTHYARGSHSNRRNLQDLPVRRITAQFINVFIETGIIRGMLGPGEGSGRALVEAGIPTYLHIRELSVSLFLSGRGSVVVRRLERRFCHSDNIMHNVRVCSVRFVCLSPPSCLYSGKLAHEMAQGFASYGCNLELL